MDDERLPQTTLLRRCRYGLPPTRRPSLSQQGHSENSQISAAAVSQRQQLTTADLPTMLTDVRGTEWSHWTPAYQLPPPDGTARCPSIHPYPAIQADSQH
nr:unnamed protein product [Spirometra erinaceieuropaei]